MLTEYVLRYYQHYQYTLCLAVYSRHYDATKILGTRSEAGDRPNLRIETQTWEASSTALQKRKLVEIHAVQTDGELVVLRVLSVLHQHWMPLRHATINHQHWMPLRHATINRECGRGGLCLQWPRDAGAGNPPAPLRPALRIRAA